MKLQRQSTRGNGEVKDNSIRGDKAGLRERETEREDEVAQI